MPIPLTFGVTTITLKLRWSADNAHPGEWPWATLLDIREGEKVEIVEIGETTFEEDEPT